ncbi:MAG: DUF3795 domain-containing protein [Armatimonadota bacterium]|nr:MAG: DUF3795 domain-containing protein [Armatimonadota bacterium]
MTGDLVDSIAYCGLVCGICTLGPESCDCRTDPKVNVQHCYQRRCCIEKGFEGCWECAGFPCDQGFYGPDNQGYRGVCVAFVECVKEHGRATLVRLLVERHGERTDYSEYVHKTPDEVMRILRGG